MSEVLSSSRHPSRYSASVLIAALGLPTPQAKASPPSSKNVAVSAANTGTAPVSCEGLNPARASQLDIDAQFDLGMDLHVCGRYEESVTVLRPLLARIPKDGDRGHVAFTLGQSCRYLGDFVGALKYFVIATEEYAQDYSEETRQRDDPGAYAVAMADNLDIVANNLAVVTLSAVPSNKGKGVVHGIKVDDVPVAAVDAKQLRQSLLGIDAEKERRDRVASSASPPSNASDPAARSASRGNTFLNKHAALVSALDRGYVALQDSADGGTGNVTLQDKQDVVIVVSKNKDHQITIDRRDGNDPSKERRAEIHVTVEDLKKGGKKIDFAEERASLELKFPGLKPEALKDVRASLGDDRPLDSSGPNRVDPGNYKLSVSAPGFETISDVDLPLLPAEKAEPKIDLVKSTPFYESPWFYVPAIVVVTAAIAGGIYLGTREEPRENVNAGTLGWTINVPR